MKPPASVKVGPFTYRLQRKDDLLDDAGKVGDCDELNTLIRYAGKADPMQIRATLLHEILHACCLTAGINTEVKLTQEVLISRVEHVLLSALRDNPKFVEWLVA